MLLFTPLSVGYPRLECYALMKTFLLITMQVWGMISDGVDGIDSTKVSLQEAADADQQFRVLLLDMWLHEKDALELVHFLYE